jgi:hypothetical protein
MKCAIHRDEAQGIIGAHSLNLCSYPLVRGQLFTNGRDRKLFHVREKSKLRFLSKLAARVFRDLSGTKLRTISVVPVAIANEMFVWKGRKYKCSSDLSSRNLAA